MPDKLAPYRGKRDFARSPEPAGRPDPDDGAGRPGPGARRFVVQRHRARRLHYDLRFEIDGVLASWAVPRGPTLDPDVKRTAVHVEDHPIEYLDFEGVIPRGEYGGGDVIVWDRGTWEPHATSDPAAAVAAGELHADVFGEKLRGRLILIQRDGGQWLLVHKHDEYAVPGWNPEQHPASVLSGRTNDEVKADPDRLWRSDLPPAQASVSLREPAEAAGDGTGRDGAPRGRAAARADSARAGGTGQPGRPGAPGPARGGRDLARVRPRAAADQPGQGAVPGAPRGGGGDQAGTDPLRRAGGPGGAALPGWPAAQHAPVPGRGRHGGVLAQAAARPRAGLAAALGRPGRRAGQDHDLPGGGRAGRAGVGGQFRRAGVARLDRAAPASRASRVTP